MVYRGRVKNGVVVLDQSVALEEGQAVSVRPLRERAVSRGKKRRTTLYERLKPFIGVIKGMPPDWASQHDHYIHGTPKRK